MPVNEFHRQVAAIVLRVAAEYGFAVGGGTALIAHGIVDRYTADLDLVSPRERAAEAAAARVEAALRAGRRHELARSKAIRAVRELDAAGTTVTFESVARAAGVSPVLALHPARHPRGGPAAA